MNIEKEIYFGNTDTFAIRYVPGYKSAEGNHYYAICHLVLGGQIIGDKNEFCYLNSWMYSLQLIKEQIKTDFLSIQHKEFNNRSDKEIFELIWKANQLEEDYKPEYLSLPKLENKVWSKCQISIDETTDAFLITMSADNEKIKFIWEGWRDPCPKDKLGKLFTVSVNVAFVVETIESCLNKIESEILNYPIK